MTAAIAHSFSRVNLAWIRLEIGLLVGALMMGA